MLEVAVVNDIPLVAQNWIKDGKSPERIIENIWSNNVKHFLLWDKRRGLEERMELHQQR